MVSYLFTSHGECPSTETTAVFIQLCEDFIEKNPAALIGMETTCFVSVLLILLNEVYSLQRCKFDVYFFSQLS